MGHHAKGKCHVLWHVTCHKCVNVPHVVFVSRFIAMDDNFLNLFDPSFSAGLGGDNPLSSDLLRLRSPTLSDVHSRSPSLTRFQIDNESDNGFSDPQAIASRSATPHTPLDSWSSTSHTNPSSHNSSRLQPDPQQFRKLEIKCHQLKNENIVLHTENSTLKWVLFYFFLLFLHN